MSLPINLNPILLFFKQLGVHVKNRVQKKVQNEKKVKSNRVPSNAEIRDDVNSPITVVKNTVDSVYVLYVLSTGIIDDIDLCKQTLSDP
jgi:hypothetical protein